MKPCKAVTSFSVSRWLKKGLSIAGIDTMMFKDHSTLVASITNVDVTVVSVCEIMKQEQWSNKSTFQKFYKKEIIDHSGTFQASILSNVIWREVVTSVTSSFKRKRRDSVLDCPVTFRKWNLGLLQGGYSIDF